MTIFVGAKSRAIHSGKISVFAGVALAVLLSASTGALAQNCNLTNVAGPAGTGVPLGTVGPGAGILGQFASAVSAQISASTSNANTVFQAGQGSAFVSAPGNPPPDSPGGGIWTRVTGGQA